MRKHKSLVGVSESPTDLSSSGPPLRRYGTDLPPFRVLDLLVSNIPSINQMYGVNRSDRGHPLYIRPAYKKAIELASSDVRKQLCGWQTASTDSYVLFALLPRLLKPSMSIQETLAPGKRRKDNHNPWKPLVDVLVKAGALYDDSLVEDEHLRRLWITDPRENITHIWVLRFQQCDFFANPEPFSIRAFFDHLSKQVYIP